MYDEAHNSFIKYKKNIDMCMVQNESEHLSPATYRQRHRQRLIASDIASDIAGASLATVQFFSHTLFSLATFWRGGEGGGREGKRWRWGGGGERKRWRWGGRLKEKK